MDPISEMYRDLHEASVALAEALKERGYKKLELSARVRSTNIDKDHSDFVNLILDPA